LYFLDELLCPAAGTYKTEGQEITLICDTRFLGYNAPTLEWFTANGIAVPGGQLIIEEDRVKYDIYIYYIT
jgi:hypothetical protein